MLWSTLFFKWVLYINVAIFKSCLRHPDSPLALGNRNAVFKSMRNAMKILKAVIQDNQYPDSNISHGMYMYLKEIQV